MSRLWRPLFALLTLCLLATLPAVARGQASGPPPWRNADDRVFPPLLLPLPSADEGPVESIDLTPRARLSNLVPLSRIVFYARGSGNWDLYTADDDGLNYQRLTGSAATEVQPAFNRGATRIAYVSNQDGDFDLYVMDANGQNPRQLTRNNADDYNPAWSPDGSRVAFDSLVDGQSEIYVVNADGSGLQRLTNSPGYDGSPTWSPDGTRIAFSSTRTGGYRIHIMNADGSNVRQFSTTPGSLYPKWSPDGNFIAYSADPNNDGWLDAQISRVDDGSGGVWLYTTGGDIQLDSWSPDQAYLAYTHVIYVLYQGQYYIHSTEMCRRDYIPNSEFDHCSNRIYSPDYSFGTSWVPVEVQPPVSALRPLPTQSAGLFTVRWSGADVGSAGLRNYDVQVQVDGGPWTDWKIATRDTEATFQGIGGKTYAFRGRARDRLYNLEPWPAGPEAVTRVEAFPPVSYFRPLPPYSTAAGLLALEWQGVDAGGSGIDHYGLQMRVGSGAWSDVLASTTASTFAFDPQAHGVQPGQTVAFRVRAVDRAQNVEAWPASLGAQTTFYGWRVSGRVFDNTGTPVNGATVSLTPAALGPSSSNADGFYGAYLAQSGNAKAAATWAKSGYGVLPPATLSLANDATLDVSLPPADNVLADGDFESTGWGAWQTSGALPATRSILAHTGAAAALLGQSHDLFNPPETLSDSSNEPNAYGSASVGPTGDLVALWVDFAKGQVLSRRYSNGAWLPPETVMSSVSSWYRGVDQDNQKRIHVLAPSSYGNLYSRLSSSGWSAPEVVSLDGLYTDVELVLGPDDRPHVFWIARRYVTDFDWLILHTQRDLFGRWSEPDVVLNSGQRALNDVAAAIAPDGTTHVAYVEQGSYDEEREFLKVIRRPPQGSWTPPAQLDLSKPDGFQPTMAMRVGPDGRVHLVWTRDVKLDASFEFVYDVFHASTAGGAWTPPELVSHAAEQSDVIVTEVGPAVLLFKSRSLAFTQRTPSGWLSPQVLGPWKIEDQGEFEYPDSAKLVMAPDGTFHAVWGQDSWTPGDTFYAYRTPGAAWSQPLNISNGGLLNLEPSIALDDGGNVHVAWTRVQDDNASPEFVYAGPPRATEASQAVLSQMVDIPAGMDAAALSFFYRQAGGAALRVSAGGDARDGASAALPATGQSYRHHWLDLSGRAGEQVTVTFEVAQATGAPLGQVAIDDVSLGTAYPDLWLRGQSPQALPGETIVQTLVVGNRGAVPGKAKLVYPLPSELTFVSADPAPAGQSPLNWDLGPLDGGSERTIRVTVRVKNSAAPFSLPSGTASVAAEAELETANNAAIIVTPLERRFFLPTVR